MNIESGILIYGLLIRRQKGRKIGLAKVEKDIPFLDWILQPIGNWKWAPMVCKYFKT